MRENNENWSIQLDTVLLEIYGLKELFKINENYLILITKLEGLKIQSNIEFMVYRKTVFECISLLRELI